MNIDFYYKKMSRKIRFYEKHNLKKHNLKRIDLFPEDISSEKFAVYRG